MARNAIEIPRFSIKFSRQKLPSNFGNFWRDNYEFLMAFRIFFWVLFKSEIPEIQKQLKGFLYRKLMALRRTLKLVRNAMKIPWFSINFFRQNLEIFGGKTMEF
jgi:hypothetical protein